MIEEGLMGVMDDADESVDSASSIFKYQCHFLALFPAVRSQMLNGVQNC